MMLGDSLVEQVLPQLLAAVLAGLVLLGLGALFPPSRRWLLQWWDRLSNGTSEDDGDAAAIQRLSDEQKVEREKQEEAAELDGLHRSGYARVLSHHGYDPVEVRFSDGSSSYYFRDLDSYRRKLEAGSYPPRRSFPGRPPEVGATRKVS